MIRNGKTDGYMVMDIGEKVSNVEEGYTITSTGAGQNPGPMTRSIFKLVQQENPADLFIHDEYIRYGQYLRIEANQHLFKKRLELCSAIQSPTVCAPLSQKQIAFLSASKPCAEGIWIVDHIDPVLRFEMQGEVIKAGDPVLIRHIKTCVYLGADDAYKLKNDFGTENEVHCCNHSTNNKSQNLALEGDGRLTVDVPTKFQQAHNVFYLQTAPDASYAREITDLAKFDINVLMKDIKAKVLDKSCFATKHLSDIFKAMGDKCQDADNFRWGLLDFGVQISKEEAQECITHFDTDNCGKINVLQFLSQL